ncbi:MATE family efflux transporter [Streptobacillus felis]|uniref:Multidrug-efflux transporter n=1 Tax=Streptobacillus felis TaxID=1384509 RepID=A0A7Z0PFV6_9FUSO|nr:MATE family efflux transporter [Streptobacillus felis]NYV27325.1 MATE family efflux transporter [Streptobacillus felis]
MNNLFKMNLDERREMIIHGDTVKTIMFLTIPIFMMAIVQVLIPFSDGLFLNKILGTDVGAGVSYMQPVYNMLIAISQGLSVVAMSMIGQLNGKGDFKGVKNVAMQVLVFGFLLGILLMPVCFYGAKYLAPIDPVIREYAITYFALSAFIIPFQFMAAIFNSIKSATGEPEATFYRMIVLLILKIIFNFIYLVIIKMGLEGAIFASLTAYIFTTIWMYYDLFIKKSKFKLDIFEYKFDYPIVKEMIRLSIPTIISFTSINFGFYLINGEVEIYGADVLAGLAIASQISNICFTVPTSIGTTVTTMISMNIGLGNVEKSKDIYRKGLIIGEIIALVLLVLVLSTSKYVISLYDPSVNVAIKTQEALNIYTYSVFPFALFIITQSVFNALGRNVYPLIMSFLRIWVFRYLFIIMTSSYLGYYSVFYGNLFSNFLAAAIFYMIIRKSSWRSNIKYE